MLCCVGLIGGFAVGQSLGGPWTYIAPAAGFGIGLVADMKFMRGTHKKGERQDPGSHAKKGTDPVPGLDAKVSNERNQVPHLGKS